MPAAKGEKVYRIRPLEWDENHRAEPVLESPVGSVSLSFPMNRTPEVLARYACTECGCGRFWQLKHSSKSQAMRAAEKWIRIRLLKALPPATTTKKKGR
jgi:hypothetical protein